jgi:chromosome segregation ATPase
MTREEIENRIIWFKDAMVNPSWREYVEDAEFLLSELSQFEENYANALSLSATYKEGWEKAEEKVKELENLKQGYQDELGYLDKKLQQAESNLSNLMEAVERHKKRTKNSTKWRRRLI